MKFYGNFHKKILIPLAAAVCIFILAGCSAEESIVTDKKVLTETVQTECQPISKNAENTAVKVSTVDTPVKTESIVTPKVIEVRNNIEKSTKDTPTKNSDTDTEKDTENISSSKNESKSKTKKNPDKDKEQPNIVTTNPPKEYHIKVKHLNQNKDMPTGCEIVSARIVLEYYGKNITYEHMLSYMTRADLKTTKDGKLYGKTPYQAFLGDPAKSSGFGCYPPVIMEMIDNYNYNDLYAESTCNLPLDFIAKTYLTQDIPVLVWATIGMGDSYLADSWYVEGEDGKPTKQKYTWRAAEHCLVLVGYDEKYYYFSDPLSYQDVTKYEKSLVEKRYKEIGYNSMIIRKYE